MFFFKQKTAYEMRISDWSSDVCSSDLTPVVYFAAYTQHTGSGVAITGSHNPPAYNGFKMMMDGKTLYGDDIQKLAQVMAEPESTDTLPSGQRRTLDLLDAYVDHIRDTVKLARPMKIAEQHDLDRQREDRKSTRLNSSH